MGLAELRAKLDATDRELLRLFAERMETVAEIAELKTREGLPLYHPEREREILDRVGAEAGELGGYARALFSTLMSLSRSYQARLGGRSLRNVALVGMPGCGKTTVGGAVAAALGRELVDTDALVVDAAGMSIPEIFELEGEAGFRAREREAVAQACAMSGVVIATGGGAVLDEANREALQRSCRVYYIERDVDALTTDGRPLSASVERLREMQRERESFYLGAADRTVRNIVAADTADEIVRDFIETSHD